MRLTVMYFSFSSLRYTQHRQARGRTRSKCANMHGSPNSAISKTKSKQDKGQGEVSAPRVRQDCIAPNRTCSH